MAKSNKKSPREQITEDLIEHLDYIQSTVDGLYSTSASVQKQVSEMIWQQLQKFEIKDKRFVAQQDLRRRMLIIEEKLENILTGKVYTKAVKDYLSSFNTIEQTNAILHRSYNDLIVDLNVITPARLVVFEQTREALYGSGIKAIYKAPVTHMLMLQATTGASISDMEKILEQWNNGDLSAGSRSPTGKSIPNLPQYTTQLARDTSYQWNGTVNEIIAQEYGLDGMLYTGNLIKDSRPLCIHLINLQRDVSLAELDALLKRPDLKPGRIPGTTVKNFFTYRGGFSCNHVGFPVRMKKLNVQ